MIMRTCLLILCALHLRSVCAFIVSFIVSPCVWLWCMTHGVLLHSVPLQQASEVGDDSDAEEDADESESST
jgi:hypothetical protein